MNFGSLAWSFHRLRAERLPTVRFGNGRNTVLFLSVRNPISLAQIYPFWYHRADFATQFGIEFAELPLERFKNGTPKRWENVAAVCFQSWFDLSTADIRDLAERIRRAFPGATLAYLDWFAPTDLRYAQALDDLVAAYVKKQVLKDRCEYLRPTLGDTNLTDYYARRFGLAEPETRFAVPESFWEKLWLSPHFAFSPEVTRYFHEAFPAGERAIDLHARIEVKGTPWYARMRQEALDRTLEFEGRFSVVCRGRVSREDYLRELYASKLCFSPFGYGEVCWRDFEAMFAGALLIKPDMSHLDCYPEAFIPHETYVPVRWDLGDLHDKVAYYLDNPDQRTRIARNAFARMQQWLQSGRFVTDAVPLFQRLGLLPSGV